tara:strand:+ start:300 stop:608 length:309 start_codon:yes stop_codon:yes gene_type:complete
MADFFENLNHFLKKDFVSDLKKILENPNNLSENIIGYLKKNKIDLKNIIDINENEELINRDPIKDKKINIQNDCNDYENLFLRLNNIENIMTEINEYLKKDN